MFLLKLYFAANMGELQLELNIATKCLFFPLIYHFIDCSIRVSWQCVGWKRAHELNAFVLKVSFGSEYDKKMVMAC